MSIIIDRIDKVRELLLSGYQAVIVSNPYNVRFLAHYLADYCYLVITADKAYYLTDGRFTIEASERLDAQYELVKVNSANVYRAIAQCIAAKDGASIATDTSVPYCDYVRMQSALSEYKFVDVTAAIERLRIAKSAQEIEMITKANAIAESALDKLKPYMVKGVSERELQLRLEYLMGMAGSEGVSFDTIVAFGSNSAHAHAKPSERKLADGDIMLFDYGAMCGGYHSDMTRTFVFGTTSGKVVEIYNSVLRAQLAAIAAVASGISAGEVDRAARESLAASGYGEYFTHSLGHGVGLEIHEAPYLRSGSTEQLVRGSVVTIEPGVYVKGLGGVRIEDMAVVGGDVITTYPKQLIVIK